EAEPDAERAMSFAVGSGLGVASELDLKGRQKDEKDHETHRRNVARFRRHAGDELLTLVTLFQIGDTTKRLRPGRRRKNQEREKKRQNRDPRDEIPRK